MTRCAPSSARSARGRRRRGRRRRRDARGIRGGAGVTADKRNDPMRFKADLLASIQHQVDWRDERGLGAETTAALRALNAWIETLPADHPRLLKLCALWGSVDDIDALAAVFDSEHTLVRLRASFRARHDADRDPEAFLEHVIHEFEQILRRGPK